MANWWEKGILSQPEVTREEGDELPEGRTASAVPGMDWLRGADWRSVLILASVAVLVVAVRGFDLWRGRQLASESQRNQLRQTIAAELTARREGDEEAYLKLLDPASNEEWRQKQIAALTALPLPPSGEEPPLIEHWQFRGDTAMVELRFPGPPATRETRFYRLDANTWRRTSPVAAFWGGRQDASAPGVRFVYREADAEAVHRTIEALQTAHRQGGVSVLTGERLTVEIVPEYVVEYERPGNRLILPSPKLSPRLASVPDSALILWRLAHPTADRLADPGDSARYRYLDSDQLIQDHLRFWLMRWQAPFPERWQIQMLETLRTARNEGRLIAPKAINLFSASRTEAYLAYYQAMVMADYVAEEYGPEKVLALEQALAQAPAWDRAISAILGIDSAAFERGWRTYLDSKLESSPTTSPGPTPTVSR